MTDNKNDLCNENKNNINYFKIKTERFKTKVKNICNDFITTTTLHGPYHIQQTTGLTRKYYIIVVILMFVMFLCHSIFLLYQYLLFPMNTNVQYQNVLYSYPDITICPTSSTSEYLMNKSLEAQNSYERISKYWQQKPIPFQSYYKNLKRSYVNNFYINSKLIGRLPYQHFISCRLNSRSCLSNIYITEHPTYYRCFTVSVDTDSILPGPTHGISLLIHRGDPSKVLLQLNEDYSFEEQESMEENELDKYYGIVIGFHDRGSYPNFQLMALPASTSAKFGEILTITMDLTSYKAANMKNRPCALSKETKSIKLVKNDPLSADSLKEPHENYLEFNYLRQSCIANVRQKLIFQTCGCFSEEYNIPYDMDKYGQIWCMDIESRTDKKIHIDETVKCVTNINLKSENDILYYYVQTNSKNKFLDSFKICPLRCDRMIHLIHSIFRDKLQSPISMSNFQNYFEYLQLKGHINPFLNESMVVNETDFIAIDINAVSEEVNAIIETPAIDMLSLVSQIGCISGLYVGITMFTLFELLDMFFRISFRSINYFISWIRWKKRSKNK